MMSFTRSVLLFCLLTSAIGHAAPGTSFSADVTITQDGKATPGKIYVDDGKMRTDLGASTAPTTHITRTDHREGINLMAPNKQYMVFPLRLSEAAEVDVFKGDAQLAASGSETVNGQMCDKFDQTYQGQKAGTLWKAKGSGAPVRYQSAGSNTVLDYSNVRVGPQPGTLFDPPADYKKFSLPFGR